MYSNYSKVYMWVHIVNTSVILLIRAQFTITFHTVDSYLV